MNRQPHEPPLSPEVASAKGLRTGWTTGTCTSAAAKAAVIGLLTSATPSVVDVALPSGKRVGFDVADALPDEPWRAAIVKDAGDDPDVTDGAHLTVEARWLDDTSDPGTVELIAGEGVGTVTLPGLGLPVGAPAINPVPERMIRAAVGEVTDRPVSLIVSVPGGEEMAAKTSNARLGIVGGISILGTTGIVRPFSTASWRASVVQQVDVAAAQGRDVMVLSTGGRTDVAAQRLFPDLPSVCFVEVGDFTGVALRRASGAGMSSAVFVGMAGKIAKLAGGVLMTHYRRSKVDVDMLADVARAAGAPIRVVAAANETATARHFTEVCVTEECFEPLAELCRRAAASCSEFVNGALQVEVIMVDFEGREVLARG
ncbi:MAG TPA: cobalt-precorrin-5B (C(1))-methyltransferase [Acidimicrobiales bacterium]|nr:cobalt-precorrin-5B (C(1))-methyltransferase [Acidimicrobiales bacterium]